MREAMDKDGFQKSLSIVERPATSCNAEAEICCSLFDNQRRWDADKSTFK